MGELNNPVPRVDPAFCQKVFENLSDIIDGEAPEDFCREVDLLLGDCEAFINYRDSLKVTVDLLRECGQEDPTAPLVDEREFASWVERVRERMVENT